MKKILYVATVVKMHIMEFHIPFLKMLKEAGWETAVAACNDYEDGECNIPYCDRYYDIAFERFPLSVSNIKAYKALKKVINEGDYDIIHCHTPMGALLTRLAARKARKNGCKVVYTAHGFHFYSGSPLINWLLYYPAEWLCSWITDVLITINQEDYTRALRHLHAKKTEYVPGVGIDMERFCTGTVDTVKKRTELGVADEEIMFLSVGELNANKNHEIVIRAIHRIGDARIKYFVCGKGELKGYLLELIAELGLEKSVRLLGYRTDISELYQAADVCVFPSKREGLPVALMEAVACKTPVICSRIRGTVDLVKEEKSYFEPMQLESVVNCMKNLLATRDGSGEKDRMLLLEETKESVEINYANLHTFELKSVLPIMKRIYLEVL